MGSKEGARSFGARLGLTEAARHVGRTKRMLRTHARWGLLPSEEREGAITFDVCQLECWDDAFRNNRLRTPLGYLPPGLLPFASRLADLLAADLAQNRKLEVLR